jgi:hypothetical protein
VETVDGDYACTIEMTAEECEEIRSDTARSHSRRRVDVIVAPPELNQRETMVPVRYHVDPLTRKMRVDPLCDPLLDPTFLSYRPDPSR